MGAGLGRLWAKRGHHVMFSFSRQAEKLRDLARDIGIQARSGTPQDAVRFADVVLLAVPWSGIGDALSDAGPLDGKIVISCVNPFGPGGLELGLTTSAAEEIAKLAPGAEVVEAFNTIFASILHSRTRRPGDSPTVFYCGDNSGAKAKVAGLIRDAGLHAVDAGPLQNARFIEPLAMLMAELGHPQRMGSDIAIRLMSNSETTELVRMVFVGARNPAAGELMADNLAADAPYGRYPVRKRGKAPTRIKNFRCALSRFQRN